MYNNNILPNRTLSPKGERTSEQLDHRKGVQVDFKNPEWLTAGKPDT